MVNIVGFISNITRRVGSNRMRMFGVMAVFVVVGVVSLFLARAATPSSSIEAEDGMSTGSTTPGNDSAASGGRFMRFASSASVWKPLKLGAGGWIRGLDMSADGSVKVVKTDTYGAYKWVGSSWKQLVTDSSMPAADRLPYSGVGTYEIRVSPQHNNRIYMAWHDTLYKSEDTGSTWQATALTGKNIHETSPGSGVFVGWDPNDTYSNRPYKMAVDPNNDSIVYVGVPGEGVHVTTNAGASWTMIPNASIPLVRGQGYDGILFDRSSSVVGGKTSVIYVHAAGRGYYRSTDAGASWSLMSGSPADLQAAAISKNGTLYVSNVYTASGATYSGLHRYRSGWSEVYRSSNGYVSSLAVRSGANLTDPDLVVIGRDSGHLNVSTDNGDRWMASDWVWGLSRTANDIPWLAWTNETYMTNGYMMFDPSAPDSLYFAQGIGVWTVSAYSFVASGTAAWQSKSAGIEQLVVNKVISAPADSVVPSGSLNVAVEDRGSFHISDPDTYPTRHQPSNLFNASWDLDYSAKTPSYLVSNYGDNQGQRLDAGYSTDGGANWVKFGSMPLGTAGANCASGSSTNAFNYGFGSMAVGDVDHANNIGHIAWSGVNKWPCYSANEGRTWNPVTISGLSPSTANLSAFSGSLWHSRHILAADKGPSAGDHKIFYMLYSSANSATGGIYKSTNDGANWSRVLAEPSSNADPMWAALHFSGYNAQIEAVPGQSGDVFFTAGHDGSTPDVATANSAFNFLRTTDGGANWSVVPNVKEVYHFGFGKPMPSSSYPTIFIVGWVNNQFGVWRSSDNCASWVNLGNFPGGSMDAVRTVSGDMNIAGRVYIGFLGSGAVYRDSQ